MGNYRQISNSKIFAVINWNKEGVVNEPTLNTILKV